MGLVFIGESTFLAAPLSGAAGGGVSIFGATVAESAGASFFASSLLLQAVKETDPKSMAPNRSMDSFEVFFIIIKVLGGKNTISIS